MTFYNRYHEARCNFFTWDNTFFYQQSQHGKCVGAGFFGKNPITVGQTNPGTSSSAGAATTFDINSLNLGLGSDQGTGFASTVTLDPRRQAFAWLPQFIFNLDCLCTGAWFDVSFAVVHARHKLGFCETTSANPANITGEAQTVLGALQARNAFATNCRHTGIDDVLVRLGYDYNYCQGDHVGLYLLGLIPTGKNFNNARWFEPLVGSKHGGIGIGIEGDYTLWNCEPDNMDLVLMSELKYTYRFKHNENRVFDLRAPNGPLSRFLLVAEPTAAQEPLETLFSNLTSCAKVTPRSSIDWWIGLHYNWCNWGLELDYNLWWRQEEKVCGQNIDFGTLGLFNQQCGGAVTNSGATIGQAFGTGTPDATFVELTSANVNFSSAAARKALSNTITAALSYTNVWCDCYPWYVGIGGGYEFVSNKYKRAAFENWNVFGKATISF